MSTLSDRCDRIRDEVTLEAMFEAMGWDMPQRGRIHCLWPEHDDKSPSMQVYPDTNSVHCFACNKGGDVVELARRCVEPNEDWSVEDALDWLERTFHLAKLTPAQTLRGRLRKALAPVRAKTARTEQAPTFFKAQAIVREAFLAVERRATRDQLAAMGPMKDYIWAEAEVPGVDLLEWATWARQIIFGSYAKMLSAFEFPEPPPGLVDDRPETRRRARLWDTHRGVEYPSDWHIQLT